MKNLIIAGIAATAVFILLIVQYPDAMLSPGEMSQGHQDIKHQCFSCHQAFGGIENDRCIACHTLEDIGRDSLAIASGSSKQVLFHKYLDKHACTACHSDHAGLTPSSAMKGFEHKMLPKNLIDNCITCHQNPADKLHDQLTDACVKCHNTSAWKLDVAFDHQMIQAANRNNCVACHKTPADEFHRSVKNDCATCHSTEKWVPSTFDHSAYFVLDSDHNAKCETCHLNQNYNQYTCYGCHEHTVSNILQEHREEGISNINNCVSCHKSSDEHEGREGGRERKKEKDDD